MGEDGGDDGGGGDEGRGGGIEQQGLGDHSEELAVRLREMRATRRF